MSSRQDFLNSLGLTEDDITDAGLPPEGAPRVSKGLANPASPPAYPQASSSKASLGEPQHAASSSSSSAATGGGGGGGGASLWDRISASDNISTAKKVQHSPAPLPPTPSPGYVAASREEEYIPLSAVGGAKEKEKETPWFGRRSPCVAPSTSQRVVSPPGEESFHHNPTQFNSMGSTASQGTMHSSQYAEGSSYASGAYSSASSVGSSSNKAKAGRRAELPVDAELQAEIDRVMNASPQSAQDLKDVGNKCFQARCFNPAIRLYTAALELKPKDHVLFSNRSAAYLQSQMVSGAVLALQDAEKCVELRPDWFKSWSRVGDALFKQKKHEKAVQAYKKSLSFDATNENTMSSLRQCEDEVGGTQARRDLAAKHTEGGSTAGGFGRGTTWDDIQQSAATGRSFKEVELMRFRNRCESRPGSRADDGDAPWKRSSDSHLSQSSDATIQGSETATAYREELMSSFRKKKI